MKMATKSEEEMKSSFVRMKRSTSSKEKVAEMKENSEDEMSESESNSSEESSDSAIIKRARKSTKMDKKMSCNECKKEFNTHKQLITHVNNNHKAFPYKCVICKSTFKMRQSFANHMKNEHPEMEMYPCDYPRCSESFPTKKKLGDHKNGHLQYICKFCKKRYARKRDMLQHISEIH